LKVDEKFGDFVEAGFYVCKHCNLQSLRSILLYSSHSNSQVCSLAFVRNRKLRVAHYTHSKHHTLWNDHTSVVEVHVTRQKNHRDRNVT